MELAGSLGIPYSQLDSVITTREYIYYVEFYKRHKRFPGQDIRPV